VKGKESKANPMTEIARYLRDIGADEKSVSRIEEVMSFYGRMLGDINVDDVFVSDSMQENGTRKFDSLWLFYPGFACEAKNFLAENDFDLSIVSKDSVIYWRLQAKDFDFQNAGDASKIGFRVDFNNRVNCELSATGKNCGYFMEVFRKYFSAYRGNAGLV
jgi:hypothetical protein